MRFTIQTEHEQTPACGNCPNQDSTANLKKKIADIQQPEDILEPIFSGQTETFIKSAVSGHAEPQQPLKQAKSVEKPAVRTIPKRNIESISTPSIKNALEGKMEDKQLSAKEQHQVYVNDDEKEEFTEEELKLKWDIFVSKLDDRPNLQSTLSNTPELKEDFRLVLEIKNTVQEDLIGSIKTELVSWLRKELKNSKIQLVTQITENMKGRIIYTDSEKYDELLAKNPSLALLRKKLNLDFGN